MEGQRILAALKEKKTLEGVDEDVKNYLAPILNANSKSKAEESQFGKYELFSLKLFKLVIELLSKCKIQENRSALKIIGIMCIESLQVCDGFSKKAPSLSFEKMLLHFAKSCFAIEESETGVMACSALYAQLTEYSSKNSTGKEARTLYKHAFDMLWKHSIRMEQKLGISASEKCLELRELAFKCLLSSEDFELAFVLDRIVKADIHYQRLHPNESSNHSVCSNESKDSIYKRLYAFHSSLLQHRDVLGLIRADQHCPAFSTSLMYILHLIHLYTKAGHREEALSHLKVALMLCNEHSDNCPKNAHTFVLAQSHCLQLWIALTEETEELVRHSPKISSLCQNLSSSLEVVGSIQTSSVDTPLLQKLLEYLEMVVTRLKGRRELFVSQREGEDEGVAIPFVHRKNFEPLKSVLLNSVECLECFVKTQVLSSSTPKLEQTARSRQLYLLSFLADVLVDLLNCEDEDDDEIETMRSSSTVVKPPYTQSVHPKQDLAESCLPLLKNSQQIITKASSGVLPASEHKWLGNDAYRLGQALFQGKLYKEASEVLRVSCEELTYWCRECKSEQQHLKRSLESHLLERFIHLCELYRIDSNYHGAMKTIEDALGSLPLAQITAQDCVSSLVGQWVKIKKEMISANQEGLTPTKQRAVQDNILQPLRQVKGLSDDVKILYLEAELKVYKSHSQPMHSSELSVIHSLLNLYTHGDKSSELNRARLTIELASISRQSCSPDDSKESPITLLDEAIVLLEPLIPSPPTTPTSSPPTTITQSFQHLATAHLWKAICIWEEHMNTCGKRSRDLSSDVDGKNEPGASKPSSDEKERESELCLSQDEEKVLMSDDVLCTVQCLYSAVEGWEGLWTTITERKISPTQFSSCFHNPACLFHHLYLTSSLCLSHSQPVLALKSLCVLLEIYCWSDSPPCELQVSYQKALALYHQLLLSFAGHELDLKTLESVSSSKPGHNETKRKGQSELKESLLHCKLVLAEWYLTRGQADSCHALLLDVLNDSLLDRSSTISFFVVAKAKLLASEYLQQCNFEIMPCKKFLTYLCSEPAPSSTGPERTFQLSPLELILDSVKIFRQLADHRNVRSTRDDDKEDTEESVVNQNSLDASSACDGLNKAFVGEDQKTTEEMKEAEDVSTQGKLSSVSHIISPVVSAWEILVSLLSALKQAARLHLLQGNVNQAHYYAKEGTMLARTMLLQGWYIEFCNLLCEIHLTRDHQDCSLVFINQVAKLLECEDYCKEIVSSMEFQLVSTPTLDKGSQPTADSSPEVRNLTFSDESDDSFLSELAGISTPKLRRVGAGQTKDNSLTTHPYSCTCLMCVSHTSLLQNVKLALLVCELAMQKVLKCQAESNADVPEFSDCVETILKVLSDANELLNNRISKCNTALKSITFSRGESLCSASKSIPKSKSFKKHTKKNQDSSPPLLDVTKSSPYFCALADLTRLTADCHLLLLQPDEAMAYIEGALRGTKSTGIDTISNEKLAQLHYTLGIAKVQELESDYPELAKSLLEGRSSSVTPSGPDKTRDRGHVGQENEPHLANLQVPQNIEPSEEDPLASKRPRRGKKTTSKSKTGCVSQKVSSSKPLPPIQLSEATSKVGEHFFIAYQMCYPSIPAFLLRDISRWLALLLSSDSPDVANHFLALSMNVSLTHQTIYSLGRKIKKHQNTDSSSPFHHAQEVLNSLTHSSLFKAQSSIPVLNARHLLQSNGSPPSLAYTKELLASSLSSQWSMCTICLAPKTHPSRPTFLILSNTEYRQRARLRADDSVIMIDSTNIQGHRKTSRSKSSRKTTRDVSGRQGALEKSTTTTSSDSPSTAMHRSTLLVKIPSNGFSFLQEFDSIHQSAAESVSLKEKTEWWKARRSLDAKMKSLLFQLESDYCLDHDSTGILSSLQSEGDLKAVILVLGQHVQRMPWECLSSLKEKTVTRMPSLAFAAAHNTLLGHNGTITVNPSSTYYVLNPNGDLQKTEKMFSTWFASETGWEGVVGKSPGHDEFATALQEKDLYVYCGHSAGKFLASSGFHLLHCQATALLLGCSSGKLVAPGKCDPSGIALNYLMAGCPALVGCLWDVTDGEIDRFCQALLKSILENNKKGKSTQRNNSSLKTLPMHVNSSRTACKLEWLVGAAPVVYGLPVTTKFVS